MRFYGLSQFIDSSSYTGVLQAQGPAPPATAESKAVIGVIEARATVNLVVAEDGVPTIAEVEAEVEVDPSVVALRVPFMFLGGMQLVIVLAAALSGWT